MGYTVLPAFTYVDDPEVAPKLPTRENMDMNISLEVARALIDPQKVLVYSHVLGTNESV